MRKKSGKLSSYKQLGLALLKTPILIPLDPIGPSNAPFIEYEIPSGSRITINAEFLREGKGSGCEKRFGPDLDLTLTASQDYDNFVAWWIGDNVEGVLNSGPAGTDDPNESDPVSEFVPTVLKTSLGQTAADVPRSISTNYYQFLEDDDMALAHTYGSIWLVVTGTRPVEVFLKDERVLMYK